MKTMKITLVAAFFIVGTTIGMAQDNNVEKKEWTKKEWKGDKVDHQQHYQKMKVELQLTDEQEAQIKAIKEKRAAEKKELKGQLMQIQKEERKEINTVLTDEQRAKMKEMHKRPQHKKREMQEKQIKQTKTIHKIEPDKK